MSHDQEVLRGAEVSQCSWKAVDKGEAARAFLLEYAALCEKHGMRVGMWASRSGDDGGLLLVSPGDETPVLGDSGACGQLPDSTWVDTYADHACAK